MSLRKLVGALGRKPVDWNQHAEFFSFTRGRFVLREKEEMAQRHIKFDMNELCKAAAASVGRVCVKVEKCPDGLYNKAFLLTMDNDEQVIAKVPNPNAGLPHFTTASEVATMDLVGATENGHKSLVTDALQMRNVLGTPVPRVLAWKSSNQNAVKAEYIVMEKVKGVQLSTVWPSMHFDQKVTIMKSIAGYQKAWARLSFSRIGSVYYTKDLKLEDPLAPVYIDDDGQSAADARFAIGPITGKEWNTLGRAGLNCDRGPCRSR